MLQRIALLLLTVIVMNTTPDLYATTEDPKEARLTASSEAPAGEDRKGQPGESTVQTKLDEVVVTATLLPTPAKELPVPVQVISRSEIDQSHAKDLSDLLIEKLPANFQTYPGALSSVGIRGFRTDTLGTDIKGRVALLIDGHRAGTGNIAVIPLENVERVEIVRGPGSVIYGSAAMGGVINIITRKGKGEPTANAAVEYGSWESVKGAAAASGGLLDDRLGLSVTARTVHSQDYRTGDGETISNTAYHDEACSLSFNATPFPNHTFFATGQYFRAWDVGTPGPTYYPDFDDTKDILRRYGSLAYDGSMPDAEVTWHVSYYNVSDKNEYHDPAAAYGYSSSTFDTDTQGVRGNFSLPPFGLGRLLVGFDWDQITTDSYTNPSGFVYSPDTQYDNYAVFAEEKVDWNRFTLLLGLRYDYFEEAIVATEGLTVVPGDDNFDHLSWRVGGKYFLCDWLSSRAAVGTGFRIPAADELTGIVEQHFLKIIGNPDLKPESSITYDIGLDAEYARLKAGLGFFYTDYTDRIAGGFPTCVGGDCSWSTFENVEGAILSGIEGNLEYQIPFSFRDPESYQDTEIRLIPFANFTYYTQRQLEDDTYARTLGSDTVPYVNEVNLIGGLKVDINRKVDLQFTALYYGSQTVQDFDFFSPTYGKAVDKGGFTLYSARFNVHPMKYCNLYLAVDNLFNKSYSFVDGYPLPGATVHVGLQARY